MANVADYMNIIKKISLGNWILIAMVSGLVVGLVLNQFVDNHFIKDVILMDNVFYLGGNIFVRLLKMLVVPLVFFSIVVGISSIADIRKIAWINVRTFLLYFITLVIGISIAIVMASVLQPGVGMTLAGNATSAAGLNQTMTDMVLNVIPENPLNALAKGEMIPVILFALIIGLILAKYKQRTPVVDTFFEEFNKIMIKMTGIVIKIAPIGVFCLMARTFGTMGFESIIPLMNFIVCVLISLVIQAFVVYPAMLMLFAKLNPLTFYRRFMSVIFFAFSTLSSNATIPLSMNKLEEIGVSASITSYTIPLGATINKNGTAIMQGVAVMFAAQSMGISLSISSILTVIFLIIMASTSTQAVPFSGIATLSLVFPSVGIPIEVIGSLTSVDHFLDMFRTAVNITGDAVCTILVAVREKSFDASLYRNKKEKPVKNM